MLLFVFTAGMAIAIAQVNAQDKIEEAEKLVKTLSLKSDIDIE